MAAVWRGHRLLLPKPARIEVCLDADEKEIVRRYCRRQGWSFSHLARTLVLSHIAREEGGAAAHALTEKRKPEERAEAIPRPER